MPQMEVGRSEFRLIAVAFDVANRIRAADNFLTDDRRLKKTREI
jgi:hypothetical protein